MASKLLLVSSSEKISISAVSPMVTISTHGLFLEVFNNDQTIIVGKIKHSFDYRIVAIRSVLQPKETNRCSSVYTQWSICLN